MSYESDRASKRGALVDEEQVTIIKVRLTLSLSSIMFPSRPALKAASVPISQPFKRSQLGLFGGQVKQYGNNNPFSKKKTRRTWLPNVQRKGLYSDALGGELTLKVTTRVLRTIKRVRTISMLA